ncbi:hypothetical protein [Salinilacihabitans rarus]|uniref:hypothetical protein n=1 Tax=Salinilacihabitans rarus TaxID=2961596 RepID=UPI0020C83D7F|nr:hypothetical protein [Salinilacihabitans rarus]
MPERPPAPPTPTATPAPGIDAPADGDDRVVATTAQLAAVLDRSLDLRVDEATLADLLLELDRRGYVEWASVTHTGEYVWDLTDSPDRIADAVADVAVERLRAWLDG